MKVSHRLFVAISSVLLSASSCSQPSQPASADEALIRQVLAAQEKAWNEGNIDGFMEGYWKSDSLQFVGTKITRGWTATLERYKTSYPDRAAMGTLRFEFFRFAFVAADTCLVTGRYTLKRDADEPTGLFTLVLKKIEGKWVIVYDHTS